MENFLPVEYKIPTKSNYMKLKEGENTFRVLSSAIIGYEYWNIENKPVRLKEMPKNTPRDLRSDENGNQSKIKHFWAFVVYNEKENSIQILELTQTGIQNAIKSLVDNVKWGNPKNYDITIVKKGEKLSTEYSVMPSPHSKLDDSIVEEYNSLNINLNALYDGGDPFNSMEEEVITF